MLFSPTAPLFAAPAQSPTVTVTPPQEATLATTVAVVDRGWPRGYTTPSGAKLIVYQPQIASWDNYRRLVAYAAVAYELPGAPKPALGSLKLEADSKVALSERLVNFSSLTITESNFPTLDKEKVRELVAEIMKAIPEDDRVISLDRVLAQVDKSQIVPKNEEGVKADPPKIFFSSGPALLVNLDGEPIWSPIKENDLKFAVNTNWDLFQHEPTKTYYLRNEKTWLKATDLSGTWTPAGKLPESFSRLPADGNWTDVKAALPGDKLSADKAPKIFVSTTPAEMILTVGTPVYQPVAGKLSWVSNSESDVFRLGGNGTVYYLVSGRWFSAPDLTGPWTFATPNLPAEFQQISLEHPRSRVLASVPGTQQAAEAVLLAQVPQTARVNKKQIKAPEVAYQGEPKFEPIEKTNLSQAVNTDKDIIKVGDLYYMCFQGVWFMAKSATGPWEATSSVPKEIYEIPVSSPVHNVTYVSVVEDQSDDEWATYATVAAYTGVMIAWGCAVWGSGWYYPPYYGWGGGYPYYYPRYPSYGYGAAYNPWTGAYGRYGAAYGPYGGAGVASRYNPRTGTYSRGAAAWGPYGARGYGEAYNPRTGAYGQTRQGSNVYGSWGSTTVQRGDQWANTRRVTSNVTGDTTRVTRTNNGTTAITNRGPGVDSGAIRTTNGDVYAGRDGNVYRRQDNGSWQKYDNGNWDSANRPTPQRDTSSTSTRSPQSTREPSTGSRSTPSSTYDQLNRDSSTRSEGTQRSRDYNTYQKSSGSSRSGSSSYRSSGGGARRSGGGGRRR
jgi:hypothetical protein